MNLRAHYSRIVKTAIIFILTFIYNVNGYPQDKNQQALQLVQNNMKEIGLSQTDLENLYVSDAHTDKISSALIVYLQQQYKAINIRNALYTLAFKNGKLVSATNSFVKRISAKEISDIPLISPQEAVSATARHLKLPPVGALELKPAAIPDSKIARERGKMVAFKKADISKKDIPVRLVWVPSGESSLNLAWEVHIDPVNKHDMWDVQIDAVKGTVLDKNNWTKECRWDEPFTPLTEISAVSSINNKNVTPWPKRVLTNKSNFSTANLNSIPLTQNSQYLVVPYPYESPLYTSGSQMFHENPWLLAGASNPAVSFGWHFDGTSDYAYTRGNNVLAQEDRDNSNTTPGYPAPSATSFPNLKFPYRLDLSNQPSSTTNLMAAITNTFYWCNIMHDISYQYGFDEAAGNFQRDNMGRGGLGNDYVQAEAQDGSGLNNANFATPPDGENPRMQMFIFNPIIQFFVNEPASIARTYNFTQINASPNSALRLTGSKAGNVILYNDNQIGSTHLACVPAYNASAINGNIAILDRGSSCALTIKIKNAQNAGAIAVIIVDNGTSALGTTDTSIKIPTIQISQVDGIAIKNELSRRPVNVTIYVSPGLDGDLDNGIIAHEYTHGISTRLTGGPKSSSCLSTVESQGMGEGWSDFYSLMVTTDWASADISDGLKRRPVGNYALGQPASGPGIRIYPYSTNMSTNPLTYSYVSQSTGLVHVIGTVWCTILWDVAWAMINSDGVINPDLYNSYGEGGNSAALKLVTLGLKLQTCNPGFVDARNAILKADSILYNGKYSCVLWNAFARRGLGVNAVQGSSESYTDQVAGFNIPDRATIKKSVDRHAAGNGEILNYNFAVICQCAALSGLTIRDSLPGNVEYISGGTLNGNQLIFSPIDVQEQQTAFFNASVRVKQSYSPPINLLNETVVSTTVNPALWTRTSILGAGQWSITHGKARSLLYAFTAPDSGSSADFTLTSTLSYPISRLATLSFWHHYDTELSWDGGVVELSTNNGTTWIDAGPYMTDNKYPSAIYNGSGTSLAGRRAFTGFSGASMIQTIIDLSTFAGQSVKFRFRFVSDVVIGGLGWFVDDVLLRTEAGIYNSADLYLDSSLMSRSSARTLISGQPPLPVLSEFDATGQNDNALISWQTTNDFNLQMFEVERSTDGSSFEVIGRLPSSVSGNTSNSYQLVDNNPVKGTNYYRLKQIDFSGKAVYSDIRSLVFGSMDLELVVRPNPSSGLVTVTLPATTTAISLNVYDSKGNLVQRKNLNGNNQKIDLSNFAKGVYILHFKVKDQTIIRKLVIQ